MILGGFASPSRGQCLIPMEVCPSSTSAHSSVIELKRISFWEVYSKYWKKETLWNHFTVVKSINISWAFKHTANTLKDGGSSITSWRRFLSAQTGWIEFNVGQALRVRLAKSNYGPKSNWDSDKRLENWCSQTLNFKLWLSLSCLAMKKFKGFSLEMHKVVRDTWANICDNNSYNKTIWISF